MCYNILKRSFFINQLFKQDMKGIRMLATILLIIGGLNWLLVAIWGSDISAWLGGPSALVPRIIYVLVGLSAIIEIFTYNKSSGNSTTM